MRFFRNLQALYKKINGGENIKPAGIPYEAKWDTELKQWIYFDQASCIRHVYHYNGIKSIYQEYKCSIDKDTYIPHGRVLAWNLFGKKEIEGNFKDGNKDGIWYLYKYNKYYPYKHDKIEKLIYSNGELINQK